MKSGTRYHGLRAALLVLAMSFLVSSVGFAADLFVHCGNPRARIKSIKQALDLLPRGPNTIHISGVCTENIVIQDIVQLTLLGDPAATIKDASDGNNSMISIGNSQRILVQNLTFRGGAQGFVCAEFSTCNFINDTFTASTFGSMYGASSGKIENTRLEGTISGPGLQVRSSNVIVGPGAVIEGNAGVGLLARFGSIVTALGVLVRGNGSTGVRAQENSVFRTNPGGGWGTVTIAQNGGHGLELQSASVAYLGSETDINSNTGYGVELRDLSFVQFDSGVSVSSTTQKVHCGPKLSATRGINLVASSPSETNCTEE